MPSGLAAKKGEKAKGVGAVNEATAQKLLRSRPKHPCCVRAS